MILHADGNSFYASCEQIYRPDLRGKPVIVLSNNDGIIIALNKEAKSCNLKRGDVYFKVKNICEKNKVSVFSSNYTLYADISRRITSIYMEYAPEIEEYSIDESFLFFNKCNWSEKNYEEIGLELKYRIGKEIGIPICVGAAPTKTLAKIYNKWAKEYGNNGVFVYNAKQVDSILERTPVEKIWGIGPARARKLINLGVSNALQLKHFPLDKAYKLFTCQGFSTIRELNGISCIDKIEREAKEVVTSSRQFGRKVYTLNELEMAVVQYTQSAVEKLRKQHSEAGGVYVYLSTCNYYCQEEALKYSNGTLVQLSVQTSYTPDIVKAAITGLHSIFRYGYGYKTVMITLVQLAPENLQGWLMFDENDIHNPEIADKKRKIMKCIDTTSEIWNRTTLTLAKGINNLPKTSTTKTALDENKNYSFINNSSSDWNMKREFLSPCYTTNINDIPKIR